MLARSFPRNRQTGLWRKLCPFFNAPKMLGALRAPAFVLKKNVATTAKGVGGESRWIAINNTPKIIISAHLPHKRLPLEQFTATLEELDTFMGKFPKHEVLMGIDANTNLAGHADGFRVGSAVSKSDMTAGDEERATFFVNFHDQERAGSAKHLDTGSSTTRRDCRQEESGSRLENRWTVF